MRSDPQQHSAVCPVTPSSVVRNDKCRLWPVHESEVHRSIELNVRLKTHRQVADSSPISVQVKTKFLCIRPHHQNTSEYVNLCHYVTNGPYTMQYKRMAWIRIYDNEEQRMAYVYFQIWQLTGWSMRNFWTLWFSAWQLHKLSYYGVFDALFKVLNVCNTRVKIRQRLSAYPKELPNINEN